MMMILLLVSFFNTLVDGFHWSLSKSKSLQVPRTLRSILAELNNAIVWMVSIHPLIFNSSSHFIMHFEIVPRAPFTFGITVTFMFHCFFSSLAMSKYSCDFFDFHPLVRLDDKVHYLVSSVFFLLIITTSGILVGIKCSFCISKSPRISWV